MRFWVGILVVFGSIIVGYLASGGHLAVLWQPSEYIVILGVGAGLFIISNSVKTLKHVGHAFKLACKGTAYTAKDYNDLLVILLTIFKLAKTKGVIALEPHIDNPQTSDVFQNFPSFCQNTQALTFLCDYLRIITMGSDNPFQVESLLDQEIEAIENDAHHMASAIQTLADAFPAVGIVAAVLGVIHTMGAIDQPPAVLGKLIGGALVGTFLGVLTSYGVVGPIASALREYSASERYFLMTIKAGLLAFLNGQAPLIAIEFARKNIDPTLRPSFSEVEQATMDIS